MTPYWRSCTSCWMDDFTGNLIRIIARLIMSCRREAVVHVSSGKCRFIERTCYGNGDRLPGYVSQNILNGATPTSINYVTGQGTGNLKREVKRIIVSQESASISSIPYRSIAKLAERSHALHTASRSCFESFEP